MLRVPQCRALLEIYLCPRLSASDVHCSCHNAKIHKKRVGRVSLIEASGAEVLFLPSVIHPSYNPIERTTLRISNVILELQC